MRNHKHWDSAKFEISHMSSGCELMSTSLSPVMVLRPDSDHVLSAEHESVAASFWRSS